MRDLSYERLHAIMLTNFYAFIEFVRSLTQKKPKKQCMSIVGISSLASIAPEKYFTIYAASKAAMETAVRCLALELAIKNTTINTIRPGVVATSRLAHLNEFTGDIGTKIKESGFQPLGLIPPEDVADMTLYLLSERQNSSPARLYPSMAARYAELNGQKPSSHPPFSDGEKSMRPATMELFAYCADTLKASHVSLMHNIFQDSNKLNELLKNKIVFYTTRQKLFFC